MNTASHFSEARKLNIIGIGGERRSMEEVAAVLEERRKNWKPREPPLGIYYEMTA